MTTSEATFAAKCFHSITGRKEASVSKEANFEELKYEIVRLTFGQYMLSEFLEELKARYCDLQGACLRHPLLELR